MKDGFGALLKLSLLDPRQFMVTRADWREITKTAGSLVPWLWSWVCVRLLSYDYSTSSAKFYAGHGVK